MNNERKIPQHCWDEHLFQNWNGTVNRPRQSTVQLSVTFCAASCTQTPSIYQHAAHTQGVQ